MKNFYLFTSLLFVGCAYDSSYEMGNDAVRHVERSISFTQCTDKSTRSAFVGKEAASLLGNKFLLSGTKSLDGGASVCVFDNYVVEYVDNSANSTLTNTANWEYVGVTPNSAVSSVSTQTVKFWDYGSSHYDFIAFSGGTSISAITPSTASSPDNGGAYSFEGSAMIADMVTVNPESYGSPVNITFKRSDSKLRLGIYETIPGYYVRNVRFYSDLGSGVSDSEAKLISSEDNIITDARCVAYYPTVGMPGHPDNNVVHVIPVAGTGHVSNIVSLGDLNYSSSGHIGTCSTEVTYSDVRSIVPNEGNSGTLTLRVDYTLESVDGSGEEITVYGAKALVPSVYCEWKPNYFYTYLFKISNHTNGNTEVNGGSDHEGLYAISFDAVVESSIEGFQETITTVEDPSVTTLVNGELPEVETHEYVDLGLSVKWATYNVGANSPEEYGKYFAWGETDGSKASYNWASYKYCDGSATTMNKYCLSASNGVVDGFSVLEQGDDAASVLWGSEWRTPTIEELKELYDNCTFSWTENYNGSGIVGAILTSKKAGYTDNSIFLPAAGYYSNSSVTTGQSGWYWANSIGAEERSYEAKCFYFLPMWGFNTPMNRYYGASVRAVHQ